jgi:periplasmic nitrate reductase NapD
MSICSLVVRARPENLTAVSDTLANMEGVEIHASSEAGKLVVTIDHPEREVCSRTMMEMQNIPGVLSSSLIYEYFEENPHNDPEGD